MSDSRHAGLHPAFVESMAGLSAGTVATLIVHPLDIVKTRMQIYRSVSDPLSKPPTTVRLLRSLTSSPRPFASLYRGLTPNLVGNATSWASFFFFKSRFERLFLLARRRQHHHHHPQQQQQHQKITHDPPPRPSATEYFFASALAGATTSILTNPIWVLKTRMLSSDPGSRGAYPSMAAGARAILHTEGVAGFYRGLAVSLVGVSHGAVQFAVYEPLKHAYFRHHRHGPITNNTTTTTTTTTNKNKQLISPQATVILSTIAKLVAAAATYPSQLVRSRLQGYQADERFGRGAVAVVVRVWREEGGPRGFYRGLVPAVVRVMPATWLTFLVYENVKFHLPRWLDVDVDVPF